MRYAVVAAALVGAVMANPPAYYSSAETSTVYETEIATVTSCGPEVTNCPASSSYEASSTTCTTEQPSAVPYTMASETASVYSSAPAYSAPAMSSAPVYSAPAMSAPVYSAPAMSSAPVYSAPAMSAPVYSAPAMSSAPVYSAPAYSAPAGSISQVSDGMFLIRNDGS